METGTPSAQIEFQAILAFYEATDCSQKAEAWLATLPIVMQSPSQQFLWFLISRIESIKALRAKFDHSSLAFVYTDLAIQILINQSHEATAAAMTIQPSVGLTLKLTPPR